MIMPDDAGGTYEADTRKVCGPVREYVIAVLQLA